MLRSLQDPTVIPLSPSPLFIPVPVGRATGEELFILPPCDLARRCFLFFKPEIIPQRRLSPEIPQQKDALVNRSVFQNYIKNVTS